MATKFKHLLIPDHWEQYWSRYPQGYTILEALINWVSQVDKMVDNVNEWNVYLDKFVDNFDKNLQGTVTDTLSEWQESGFLDVVIDEALQTQIDVVEDHVNRVDDQLKDTIDSLAFTNDILNRLATVAPSPVEEDMTEILQSVFDSATDGDIIRIPKGVYHVSKNTQLTGFNNDQPCLLLRDKKNIRIMADGAIFKTDTHAQGILELQRCENVAIEGLTLIGYGEYPSLDGNSGRGEKGTADDGYHTTGFWGYYKNNSYVTSSRTKNGVEWGTFGGGYIGNVAYGLLIHNACKNIVIRECEVTGFNYAGFAVGHFGDLYSESENVSFENCYAHDNYNTNFHLAFVNQCKVDSCKSLRAGHPDAIPMENTYVDPGYGIACTGIAHGQPRNVVIENSVFKDCVRKGIDAHAGVNLNIIGNYVENCYFNGIATFWTTPSQPTRDVIIDSNKLYRCGVLNMAITARGCIDEHYSISNIKMNSSIINNLLQECAGTRAIIYSRVFDGMEISNNTIEGVDSRYNGNTLRAISCGEDQKSYNLKARGNVIKDGGGKLQIGMYFSNVETGAVTDNIVDIASSIDGVGLYAVDTGMLSFLNNYAKLRTTGTPLALTRTRGVVTNNVGEGGTNPNAVAFNKQGDASFDRLQANSLTSSPNFSTGGRHKYISFVGVPDKFVGLLSDSTGRWILFNSSNANSIQEILANNMDLVTNSSPSGTTGQDGYTTVFKQAGNLHIENRHSDTVTYTLTILG